ncbi:MAG: oligosaccharide repeat unit polymerase [Methanococci archaeon]|nr:oligosaccharide repeat unit polymerase [Methanococci archaeon]
MRKTEKIMGEIKDTVAKMDIFHPILIVIFGYTVIFLLATPYLKNFSIFELFKIFLVIVLFIFGFSIPFLIDNLLKRIGLTKTIFNNKDNIKIKNNTLIYIFLLLFSLFSIFGAFIATHSLFLAIIYLLFILAVVEIFIKLHRTKIINYIMLTVGILSFLLIVVIYGGIPLFNYDIRMAINSEPLRLIATGALVYSGIENKFFFIISFLILVLLGYKAGVLMLFVAYIIYNRANISLKKMIFLAIVALLLLGVMGKIILLSSHQHWKLDPLGLLSYRAYFDLQVLNKIINGGVLTFGEITLVPNGEEKIGEILFNYKHNITTTLFGTLYLDYGIFGVIASTILGAMSKYIYQGDKKLYAIYASILLSYCEIGINYGFLIVLFLLLYVNSKLKNVKKIKN